MKKTFVILMIAVAFLACGLQGYAKTSDSVSTEVMEGSVGSYPVHMQLTFQKDKKVTGWYYYDKKGSSNKIKLSGTYKGDMTDNTFTIRETSNGKVTGTFSGEYAFGIIESAWGTWTSATGKKLKWTVQYYHPEIDD